MKKIAFAVTGLAALLLATGSSLPVHAEDAAAPAAPAAGQPAPANVPRPSIAPKAAEPATAPAAASDPAARPQRRYVHRSHRRYGAYRTAYWQPFPIYWPHIHHHRIYWNRIPWIFRF